MLSYFDQERVCVIFKGANARVIGTINDPWQSGLPWRYPWAQEHGADGR